MPPARLKPIYSDNAQACSSSSILPSTSRKKRSRCWAFEVVPSSRQISPDPECPRKVVEPKGAKRRSSYTFAPGPHLLSKPTSSD